MRKRLLRAVMVTIAIMGLAACGATSATAGVGDAFAARAVAICSAALESKAAWRPFPLAAFDPNHPDREKLKDAAPWLAEVVAPTFQDWRDGLVALGDPSNGRAAWTEVLAAVDTIVIGNERQIEAALAGDPAAFARATSTLQAAQPVLIAAAAAAGVPSCAEVHGS